jgi:hypothetical protein
MIVFGLLVIVTILLWCSLVLSSFDLGRFINLESIFSLTQTHIMDSDLALTVLITDTSIPRETDIFAYASRHQLISRLVQSKEPLAHVAFINTKIRRRNEKMEEMRTLIGNLRTKADPARSYNFMTMTEMLSVLPP